MLEKIIYADDYLFTGEPSVRLLDLTPGNEIIKTAYRLPNSTDHYIKGIAAKDGNSYLLITALGASGILYKGGVWGQNRNADYFAENDLIETQDEQEALRNPIGKKGLSTKRYKTFENGHFFSNHANKDPNKAIGIILFSDYDLDMHRVLLIVEFWRAKDRFLSGMVDNNVPISTSMGCKVPGDYCTICDNYAHKPDRSDACVHVKTMKGKILPDGRRVGMINKKPRFFDLSHVFVGADATSRVLMKVASSDWEKVAKYSYVMPKYYLAGGLSKKAEEKKATLQKVIPPDEINGQQLADLTKILQRARNNEPDIPNELLDKIYGMTNMEKVSALVGLGIIPHSIELKHLNIEESDLTKVDPFLNEKVANIVQDYIPYRTIYEPYLTARLINKNTKLKRSLIKKASMLASILIAGALYSKISQVLLTKLPKGSFGAKLLGVPIPLQAVAVAGTYGIGRSLFNTTPAPNTVNSGQIYVPENFSITKLSKLYASLERTENGTKGHLNGRDLIKAVYLNDENKEIPYILENGSSKYE